MRVLIKGCASTGTPVHETLDQWLHEAPHTRIFVWGLNDQRNQTWHEGHDEWHHNIRLQWFQLHGLRHMMEAHGEDYMVWLSGLDCPLWMFQEQIDRWPSYVNSDLNLDIPAPQYTKPYPIHEAVQLAGRKYITNSFSYQVALGVILGATHIHLTGINVGEDTVRLWKSRNDAADLLDIDSAWSASDELRENIIRDLQGKGVGEESWIIPNLEFWFGIARGRGITVTINGGQLFHDKWGGLYGYEAGGEY